MNTQARNASKASVGAESLSDVFRSIEHLQKKLAHVQRQTVSHSGLTPPQYTTLMQLWDRDGQPLNALAAGNHCTPATMTTIVDSLERKGLVARQRDPSDRRRVQVRLTAAGTELRAATPSVEEMFAGCCAGLSPAETETLLRLLSKLDSALTRWEPGR